MGVEEDRLRDELFQAEFGQYFSAVSADSPVGVCSKCITVRSRDEVDSNEKCPADLDVNAAKLHDWVGFSEAEKLKEFIQQNISRFRQLVEQASVEVTIEPTDD